MRNLQRIYLFLMPPVYLAAGLYLIILGANRLMSGQSAMGIVIFIYGVVRLVRIFFRRSHAQTSQE